MKIIILAWWSGTRLWPMSRDILPKQFIEVEEWVSLIQSTVERVLEIEKPENILISTNEKYKFHALWHVWKYWINKTIIEPNKKNTAPAIAMIIKYLEEIEYADENETLLILPSDHIISPANKFKEYMIKAEKIAKEWKIVLFWINPTKPETWYWYIKYKDKKWKSECFDIEKFVEKPNLETAKKYLIDWIYLWNSGMFMWTIKTLLKEFKINSSEIFDYLTNNYDTFVKIYDSMPEISFDYAVLEKTKNSVVMPMNIVWSDVGSWDSIYEIWKKDKDNNCTRWNVMLNDVSNSMIWSIDDRLVVADSLNDMLVLDTKDALYITNKWNSQNIKNVVDKLKKIWSKEVDEHLTVYRPWWFYTVLEEQPTYKIKVIWVNQWAKLSLQRHYHRSEHWVVVWWTAKVSCWKDMDNIKEILMVENESIFIPKTHMHRLENPWKEMLYIIEAQVWTYLEEDDIERFDDIYNRKW